MYASNQLISRSRLLTTSPVANSSKETIQLITYILYYPKFHYCMYKSPPLGSIIKEVTPFQDFPPNFRSILTSCCHLILRIQRRCISSSFFFFSTTSLLFLFSSMTFGDHKEKSLTYMNLFCRHN